MHLDRQSKAEGILAEARAKIDATCIYSPYIYIYIYIYICIDGKTSADIYA